VVTPPHVGGPLRLHPFTGWRLSPPRVGDPASARLFARPYDEVPPRMERWRRRGLVLRDPSPALYLHEYTAGDTTIRGLVGALDITQRASGPGARAVLPHEGIYPGQADELADRMARMRVNPAPILLVQRGPQPLRALLHRVRTTVPDHQFVDRAGQSHRLWALRDPTTLATIDAELGPTSALIADGHHRYAAYLRLQQRRRSPATDLGLAMLVDQDDTPLTLGPIHRLLVGTTLDDVESTASLLGLATTAAARDDVVVDDRTVAATDGRRWLALHLSGRPDLSAVEQVHDQFIPAVAHGPTRLTYHHRVDDVIALADPQHATALVMPPPDLDLVTRLAREDRLLPEKATSFQPKPSLGVFIRSWADGSDVPG